MSSAVTSTTASAVSSGIEDPQSKDMNGKYSTFNPDPLKNRRAPTYAKAGDLFPKTRTFSSSIEDAIKPLFEAHDKSQAKPKAKTPERIRISRPVELIKPEYDVVVIGSGYGGGVAASRMARARQSVCVLELGREKWPGEYPETLSEARWQLHASGDFSPFDAGHAAQICAGDTTGLYHLVFGDGQNAFVANGLGGTSLLNANVFLEADRKTMAMSPWPEEIRQDPKCLDPYYQRARRMLEPATYPKDWPRLPKMEMLRRQAEALGLAENFREVEQTTRFKDGRNSSGVEMKKSTLTGMDSTGVNDGSKSSTLVTYLADAWNWGAEIFCACEVRHIVKHPKEGYLIFFAWHGCRRHKFKDIFYQDLMWVHAKKFVFLGAGSLGSTEILLRSRSMGMTMSQRVGERMSGNGDMLAFGYNLNDTVRAMSNPHPPPGKEVGPTITSIIDCREQKHAIDGYVIEEGTIPRALFPIISGMMDFMPGSIKPTGLTSSDRFRRLIASINTHFRKDYYHDKGSLERTQVYLIMCHDDNQAVLTLRNNRPFIQYKGSGRAKHVRELTEKLNQATASQEGKFVNNPFAAASSQSITVHPIGGAAMSNDGSMDNGVTNHLGEVLKGDNGEVWDGLVVTDGSIIPTALGANPFATITALAERAVEQVAEKKGIFIDYETKNGDLDFLHKPPEHPLENEVFNKDAAFVREALVTHKEGIEFSEIMKGHVHIGDYIKEYEVAERFARGRCQEARFFLSVHAYDANTLLSTDSHNAMLTGTFTCGALPASPYMVIGGNFQLFNEDPNTPDTTNLTYDYEMQGTDGSKIHFHGYKVVDDEAAFSIPGMWRATTTLRVTLTDPNKPKGEDFIGRGLLYIDPSDFIQELKTYYSSMQSARALVAFFVKQLAHVFFAPFDFLHWPQHPYESWSHRHEPIVNFEVMASDGIRTVMKMWEPLDNTPHQDLDLLFLPGAAVDESIFALDSIDVNAITFFRQKGYRCFCLVHRVGRDPLAKREFTTHDARLDVAAAIDKVETLRHGLDQSSRVPYGPMDTSKTYIVGHCAGSVALSMGLLDGSVNTSSIAGITASNVFMDPVFARANKLKASSPIPLPAVYSLFTRSNWFDCTSTPTDTFVQLGLNQLLRFYPVPSKKDFCKSVVCHRSSLVFGMLWRHKNLNSQTHRQLEKVVGGTSMTSLKHLMAMGIKKKVLTSKGSDMLITDRNMERLRGIPIYLFSGVENCVYTPESTRLSYDRLQQQLGEHWYSRDEFEDYGHLDCWMGEHAHEVVYPRVLQHIEKVGEFVAEKGLNGFNGVIAEDTQANGTAMNGFAH